MQSRGKTMEIITIIISSIRENLFDISNYVKLIKIIYFPVQKEIKGNETADELPNIATKISKTVELTYSITTPDIKTKNSKLSFKKWQRR